ncbi:MAG: SPFH domain-containing protein, partial [Roseiarcus sp.]
MSGLLIGTLILWLIIAIIVVVVAVYVVNWLYHRSSKEVSFVRTGFLGERVVINGGAFVLPFIHDFTPVNMNVLPMQIVRQKGDAVITRDRMRIDIEADFYVRVEATREAVSIAAATLGRRTLEPERLHALLSGKFVSALRSGASEMTMEQMHEQRGEYVARVKAAAQEALAQNGLELESVAITDLDQTDLEFFNPSNRFDAEGLTRLMEDIEDRRKLRNDIEQDSMIKIRTRNLEAERQALDIERDSEAARLAQQRDIEVRRAVQRAEVARERALRETEAEQAQISAREAIEKSRIANEQAISEARIASEREVRQKEIERTRAVEEIEIAAREGIERARIVNQRSVDTARIASEREVRQTEIERARAVEEAEIEAREVVEKARILQERAVTESRIVNEEETRRREIERTRAVEE